MKVCILTPEFLPEWGGIGTYAYNLAQGLAQSDDVHVVTGHAAGVANGGHELDNVSVHSLLPQNGGVDTVAPFRFQVAVLRRLPGLAREHGWDIIHANHAYMSDLLARLRPTPASTVLTVHTTLETQTHGTEGAGADVPRERSEANVARLRFALKAVERRYLRRTSSMIFVSRWVQDSMRRRYGVEPPLSDVIPNAIDGALFSPRDGDLPASNPTLLFAGRLMALKGVGTLLRAMTRLPDDVRLLLAGPGDPAPWRDFARRIGLADHRYEFLGRVHYSEMPALYRRVNALVLPSFTESCPMTALEAMACGTPLIAAAAGGIPEIVRNEETGWLFPPGNHEALAGLIETVLADPTRRERTAARARAWVQTNASIDRMVDRTRRFYERALAA